jgi:hypothetical protein
LCHAECDIFEDTAVYFYKTERGGNKMWVNVGVLVGKILTRIDVSKSRDKIIFHCQNGEKYVMLHEQDCCESVDIEDIIGDLDDLIGSPIIRATEDESEENPEGIEEVYQDSFTWTFYNFATEKGHVTIRWYGESNGYYSEAVSFCEWREGEEVG